MCQATVTISEWVSQPQDSKQDGATTKCHSITKKKAQWPGVKQVPVGTTERKEGIIYNVVEDPSIHISASGVIYESKRNIISNPQNKLFSTCTHQRKYILKYNMALNTTWPGSNHLQ